MNRFARALKTKTRTLGAWHLMRAGTRGACGVRVVKASRGLVEWTEPLMSVAAVLAFARLRLSEAVVGRRRAAICRRCCFGDGGAGRQRHASGDFDYLTRIAGRLLAQRLRSDVRR